MNECMIGAPGTLFTLGAKGTAVPIGPPYMCLS